MLSDLFPRSKRTRAIAIYASGGTVGSGLTYVVGGAILQIFPSEATLVLPVIGDIRGWQLIFLILGFPGLLLAAVVALVLREPLRSASQPRERRPLSARSEEHTSELQSLMRISYAVFCLKKKIKEQQKTI